jgi:transcriptional regulator with XRE-family HTH domain
MVSADAARFSAWLARWLAYRRISQRSLAARSGVNHATISRILAGRSEPSLATALALARAAGGLASFLRAME